jgi:sulfate permease, SulP family
MIPELFKYLKINRYNFQTLRCDLVAGLTVAIVALPLSMALAIASGASPEKGLITAIVAGFFISLLGGTRLQIGGPTGAFIIIVYDVIAKYGYDGLLLATFLAGIILIIAGYLRLGKIIEHVSHSVITGFTAGLAIVLASSQIKDFFGLSIDQIPSHFIEKWGVYFANFNSINFFALVIAAGSLLVIIVQRKYFSKLPGFLMVVILASLSIYLFQLPVETIGSKYPGIGQDLLRPAFPVWNGSLIIQLLPSAFTIAFLAAVESLLCAVITDRMTDYKHNPNQELVGQGIANIASSIFGGVSATGALARTVTNIQAGAKTPIAGITHCLLILLFVMFGMNLTTYIPLACLSGILMVVAWNMSEAKNFMALFKDSKIDYAIMLITFFTTIFIGVSESISIGLILSFIAKKWFEPAKS